MAPQRKDNSAEFTEFPNDNYRKFFEKFKEIESLDVLDWKPPHIIAYFCFKYYDQYNSKYKFKFNSPVPGKCFEVFQIKKLSSMLTSKPNLLRDYINWIFEHKVILAKRKITSISFLTKEEYVNDYKFNVLLANDFDKKIDRSTILPDKILDLCQNFGISTYGDLAFLNQADKNSEILSFFNSLEQEGFDFSILEKIV